MTILTLWKRHLRLREVKWPPQAMESVTSKTEISGTCYFQGDPTEYSQALPHRESVWRKGQEDGWDRAQVRQRQGTPILSNLFPMVDELGNNFYLLARFLCKYPLSLSSLPHKFCSEIHDVCAFLVLRDLFSFLVGRGSLIKGAESPIWVGPPGPRGHAEAA